LPPLLILGGISGAGMTTFMADYRPIFMVVTVGLLGSAFYLTYRRRPTSASTDEAARAPITRATRLNRIMLWTVTVVALVFLFCPQTVMSLFTTTEETADEFTVEMTRTVIQIEGMT